MGIEIIAEKIEQAVKMAEELEKMSGEEPKLENKPENVSLILQEKIKELTELERQTREFMEKLNSPEYVVAVYNPTTKDLCYVDNIKFQYNIANVKANLCSAVSSYRREKIRHYLINLVGEE